MGAQARDKSSQGGIGAASRGERRVTFVALAIA
jgi:hypothetical protein